MQRRTCSLCGNKDFSNFLTHKGNAKFVCKDTEACQDRQLAKLPSKTLGVREKTINRYVVTTAVVGCEASDALYSVLAYCKENNAELIVLPIKYKHIETASGYIGGTLDNRLSEYALYGRRQITPELQILGDLQVSPTATNPLSGLRPICQGMSTIVPSTQLALDSVPTAHGSRALFLWGTGSITKPVYSDSKAGYKGSFHHSISALVVEIDINNDFYIRNLPIDKQGDLIDLTEVYTSEGLTGKLDYNLILGDIHVGSQCPDNLETISDLVSQLGRPENLILHDVFDGATINHHELNNPFAKISEPFNSLRSELLANVNFLNYVASDWSDSVYVVDSNHHDFLIKWLKAVDWKTLDTGTSEIYLALAHSLMSRRQDKPLFEAILNYVSDSESTPLARNVKFLQSDESLVIYQNELGMHGHLGGNGARGTKSAWVNAGVKTITGHTHSAFIDKSAFGTGTSTKLKLNYTKGLSSWSNSHVIEYENGKRQLFTCYKGKFKA